MQLTKEELYAIQLECSHYKNSRAAAIEALKIVQQNYRWVSDEAMYIIADILNISIADLEGVATFYNQIFRQPVGRHIVRYCDSIVCYINGCIKIQETLENILNINTGETTKDDKFTLLPTCCLGWCNKAPIIMIDECIYSCVIPSKIDQILRYIDDF